MGRGVKHYEQSLSPVSTPMLDCLGEHGHVQNTKNKFVFFYISSYLIQIIIIVNSLVNNKF